MTLLEECKALVENRDNWIFTDQLRTIIRRHEHDDWKGWWKCDGCCRVLTQGEAVTHNCYGELHPYERRRAERRKA